jgi:hypothetical protein
MERGNTTAVDTDGTLHLTIDTSVLNQSKTRNHASDIPHLVTSPPEEAVVDDNMLSIKQSNHHHSGRKMRPTSDSPTFDWRSGVRIPARQKSHVSSQFTPPMTESPSFDAHHPYATSVHLYSAESTLNEELPESPQSSTGAFVPGRRNSRGLVLSLQHNEEDKLTLAKTMPETIPRTAPFHRSSSESATRSLSDSYGVHHHHHHQRTSTFVDASSYDEVPDSPAKLVSLLYEIIYTNVR